MMAVARRRLLLDMRLPRAFTQWLLWPTALPFFQVAMLLLFMANDDYLDGHGSSSVFTSLDGFVFWHKALEVKVKEWKLNGISINSKETESMLPTYQLNVNLDMVVEIAIFNHTGLVYDTIVIWIVYRGNKIEQVQAESFRIGAHSQA